MPLPARTWPEHWTTSVPAANNSMKMVVKCIACEAPFDSIEVTRTHLLDHISNFPDYNHKLLAIMLGQRICHHTGCSFSTTAASQAALFRHERQNHDGAEELSTTSSFVRVVREMKLPAPETNQHQPTHVIQRKNKEYLRKAQECVALRMVEQVLASKYGQYYAANLLHFDPQERPDPNQEELYRRYLIKIHDKLSPAKLDSLELVPPEHKAAAAEDVMKMESMALPNNPAGIEADIKEMRAKYARYEI